MKIDFARTQRVVGAMLQKAVASLAKKHPDVVVKKLTLWGYGFGKCAHVLLETSDDEAVLEDSTGEYNENEFDGVYFDEWWPDLYACAEGEPYEIHLADGSVMKTYQSKEGNNAIDKPLFAMLKQVLKATDLGKVRRGKSLTLAVEMGSSPLAETWKYKGK